MKQKQPDLTIKELVEQSYVHKPNYGHRYYDDDDDDYSDHY